MNLKLAKDVKAAVEINGHVFISFENNNLYEYIDENEALIYIKSNDGNEIKIKIVKTIEETK